MGFNMISHKCRLCLENWCSFVHMLWNIGS